MLTTYVKPCQGHERVVRILLERDNNVGGLIPNLDKVLVVGRLERFEEARADGEDGHILSVRVALGVIGNQMVNIVTRLPPVEAL